MKGLKEINLYKILTNDILFATNNKTCITLSTHYSFKKLKKYLQANYLRCKIIVT